MSKIKSKNIFYENLTMGLMKNLSKNPRILNINLKKNQPCHKDQINNWEQTHNVYLPDDMKNFYQSIDGFTLSWSYKYSPKDICRVGYLKIPSLFNITLSSESIEKLITLSSADLQQKGATRSGPLLTAKTKIFELNTLGDIAKVCLVYETTGLASPKLYLLETKNSTWQFLAESFTEYLRMAIAHLGLWNWELCFSSYGMPPWTEQLFLLLAPHLLEKNAAKLNRYIKPVNEIIYNHVDLNIFKKKL